MIKLTVSEYAKHRGIHERSIRRYLANGAIPEKAIIRKGRLLFINREKADQALARNVITRREILGDEILPVGQGSATQGQVKKVILPVGKPSEAQQAQVAAQAGTSGLSFQEARTLKERFKTALLKITLDEKTGRLVEAEQVKVAAFNKARLVRDALLNIPDRISPILAAESDQGRVTELLIGEIRQVLEELSK